MPQAMAYTQIWYEMLFWQHAVTAHLHTMRATETGAHIRSTCMQTVQLQSEDAVMAFCHVGIACQILGVCRRP